MGKKNRQRDEFWKEAKRICRLNARQIAMAKRLGMNPKKLPGLIPSKSQPWKAPVGIFIEELHAKRFGDELPASERDDRARSAEQRPRAGKRDPSVRQVEDLVCYFANLSDALERGLAEQRVTAEMLSELVADLRRLAADLEAGRPIPQVPEPYFGDAEELEGDWVSTTESERSAVESTQDDDEIPF